MQQSGDLPHPQGLYDPQHEHDACGVGFVVDLKGRKSHAIVEQGARRSWSTSSTAAPAAARRTPATAPASSSRCRTRFLRAVQALGFDAAARRRVRRRPGLPAARRRRARRRSRRCSSSIVARGGPAAPRLARRADRRLERSAIARAPAEPVVRAGVHRPRQRAGALEHGPAAVRAQALRHPQARREARSTRSTLAERSTFYVAEPVVARRSSTRAC